MILNALSNQANAHDFWYEGSFHVGSGLKVSYISQQTDHLFGTLSGYAHEKGIDESLFKTILRKMDFERVQFEKRIENERPTLLFVEHDRAFTEKMATKTINLG